MPSTQTRRTTLEIIEDHTFHEDTAASTHFQKATVGSEVVRSVAWDFSGYRSATNDFDASLEKILGEVDEYFQALAQAIGGVVVSHSWAILVSECSQAQRNSRVTELQRLTGLPDTIYPKLVAKVMKMDGIPLADRHTGNVYKSTHRRIIHPANAALVSFETEHMRVAGWSIPDASNCRQFMTADGMTALDNATLTAAVNPVFVDIEPFSVAAPSKCS